MSRFNDSRCYCDVASGIQTIVQVISEDIDASRRAVLIESQVCEFVDSQRVGVRLRVHALCEGMVVGEGCEGSVTSIGTSELHFMFRHVCVESGMK